MEVSSKTQLKSFFLMEENTLEKSKISTLDSKESLNILMVMCMKDFSKTEWKMKLEFLFVKTEANMKAGGTMINKDGHGKEFNSKPF